jgi:hypothetical protein
MDKGGGLYQLTPSGANPLWTWIFAKGFGVCYLGGVLRHCLLIALVGCGGSGSTPPTKKDAGVIADAAVLDLPARPLGLPDLASYAWRKRGGHPAFRIARTAESKNQWKDVVTTCKQALAADPGHLEAAWLLAAGLGRLGKADEVLGPLQIAAAGDFGKWGFASLELPELQTFLRTPIGEAWKRRVETDRIAYIGALARAQFVASAGDLYGYDPDGPRWYRITRTFGAVVGALRVTPTKIAYVTRQRGKDKKATMAIGVVDLSRGKTSKPIELGTPGPIYVSYSAKVDPSLRAGIWVFWGNQWHLFDDDYKLTALGKATRPAGPWLEVKSRSARLHAIPVTGVTADWDDKGIASQIRIAKSNRIVTVPAPGLIDGNTLSWSPDRSRIAFVAQLDDQCTPGAVNAAAFVADATTGAATEIDRAESMAIEWMTDRKLLVDKGGGLKIYDLDGGPPVALEGADGLLSPRRRPSCTPPPPDEPTDPDPADPGVETQDDKAPQPSESPAER